MELGSSGFQSLGEESQGDSQHGRSCRQVKEGERWGGTIGLDHEEHTDDNLGREGAVGW